MIKHWPSPLFCQNVTIYTVWPKWHLKSLHDSIGMANITGRRLASKQQNRMQANSGAPLLQVLDYAENVSCPLPQENDN